MGLSRAEIRDTASLKDRQTGLRLGKLVIVASHERKDRMTHLTTLSMKEVSSRSSHDMSAASAVFFSRAADHEWYDRQTVSVTCHQRFLL